MLVCLYVCFRENNSRVHTYKLSDTSDILITNSGTNLRALGNLFVDIVHLARNGSKWPIANKLASSTTWWRHPLFTTVKSRALLFNKYLHSYKHRLAACWEKFINFFPFFTFLFYSCVYFFLGDECHCGISIFFFYFWFSFFFLSIYIQSVRGCIVLIRSWLLIIGIMNRKAIEKL